MALANIIALPKFQINESLNDNSFNIKSKAFNLKA